MREELVVLDVSVIQESDIIIIGFAETEFSNARGLIFQISEVLDKQDTDLGFDNLYIEYGSQLHAQYGGIDEISLKNDTLSIDIASDSFIMKQTGISGFDLRLNSKTKSLTDAISILKNACNKFGVKCNI